MLIIVQFKFRKIISFVTIIPIEVPLQHLLRDGVQKEFADVDGGRAMDVRAARRCGRLVILLLISY